MSEQEDIHKYCLKFPINFETLQVQAIQIGRFQVGDGTVRLALTPLGVILLVPKSLVDKQMVIIMDDSMLNIGPMAHFKKE